MNAKGCINQVYMIYLWLISYELPEKYKIFYPETKIFLIFTFDKYTGMPFNFLVILSVVSSNKVLT